MFLAVNNSLPTLVVFYEFLWGLMIVGLLSFASLNAHDIETRPEASILQY